MREIPTFPRFRAVADHALLVEFGETISSEAHGAVLRLDAALALTPFPGFRESVPAYVNLLIEFDPLTADFASARAATEALLMSTPMSTRRSELREALVCYDEELAPDLAAVAEMTGLGVEAVVAAHLAGEYCVYMYGFAPGYAYLAGVPKALQLPRKPAPTPGVEAGAVIIAGPQCLITTLTMPTGWWRIGRSPTSVLTGNAEKPFLFEVGDRVSFRRISRAEYDSSRS